VIVRDQIRESTAGFAVAAVALVAWPGRSELGNLSILAIGLGGLIAGMLLWMILVERRLPWPLARPGRRGDRPGTALTGFLAWIVAFAVGQISIGVWPIRGEVYLDQPIVTTSPDGLSVSQTWVTSFDIPDNAARFMVAFMATYVGMTVIAWPFASAAVRAWSGRRASKVADAA
jgi:hypothetical protein